MTIIRATAQNWKEIRRWRALDLKQCGWKQKDIAEAVGVTPGAVSQWMTAVERQGDAALRARPHPGATPRLSEAQKRLIPDFLLHGAEAYGFRGEVWTCARVVKVIESEFGVLYHKAHVSRLLKELDWTPQKPIRRAAQRNEVEIASWRTEVWPELKKERRRNAGRLFLWMNRAFTCCRVLSEPMHPADTRRSCDLSKPVTICPS
jgi:transposase